MHDCPDCGMACDCDGEDTWHSWPANANCTHVCDWPDEDDDPPDEWLHSWADYPGELLAGSIEFDEMRDEE